VTAVVLCLLATAQGVCYCGSQTSHKPTH